MAKQKKEELPQEGIPEVLPTTPPGEIKADDPGEIKTDDPGEIKTPAEGEDDKHCKKADELMLKMYLDKIYRTGDGQWFSDPQNADTHAKKIDSEVQTYSKRK